MTRGHQPGHAVISGGRTWFVTARGEYVPFDRARSDAHRSRQRRARRDDRLQTI